MNTKEKRDYNVFISLFGKRQRERHSSYLSSPSWQGPAHMSELTERLSRWDLHPEKTVTHRFILEEAAEAYPRCEGGAIRESDNCFCVAVGRCCRNAANIRRRGFPSGRVARVGAVRYHGAFFLLPKKIRL